VTLTGPVILTLPYPPSANKLWRAVRDRNIKSEAYREWSSRAAWEVRLQKPRQVLGRYVLTVTATRPDRRARDLGNLEKPLSDCLVQTGVVTDDSLAKRIVLEWSDEIIKGGSITVQVEEA
jgi:crossover junction endodeoxyribonuclease RusA